MRKLSITFIFALVLTLSAASASAFIGPSAGQTPGSGGGLFTVDANRNIGFGTTNATPTSTFDNVGGGTGEGHGYVFLVASTSNPGLGLRNTSLNHMYLWSVRNIGSQSRIDLYRESPVLPGKILMSVDQLGFVGISAAPTSTYRLYVGQGDIGTTGSFVGAVSGAVNAGNVASGVFGSLQGNGNFAFPAALGVGTSTTSGLPANGLYVAGPATFADHITFSGAAGYDALRLNNEDIVNVNSITFGDPGLNEGIIFGGGAGGNVAISLIDDTLDDSVVVTGPSTLKFGIGTTGPTARLDVVGFSGISTSAGGSLDRVWLQNPFEASSGFTRLVVGGNLYWDDGANVWTYGANGSNGFGAMLAYGNSGLRFYTKASDGVTGGTITDASLQASYARMVIDQLGNVGIATTTPAYGLDVWGTGRFTGQLTVPTPTAGGSAANKSYVDSVVGGGGQSGSFTTLSVSSTSTLAVSSGNVGIGTANPAYKLVVNGITHLQNTVYVSDGISIGAFNGNGSRIFFNTTTGLQFHNDNGEFVRFTNDNPGRVGIGTTGPQARLHVTGDSIFSAAVSSGGLKLQAADVAGNNSSRVFFNEDDTANLYGFSWIYAGAANPTLGGTAFTLPENYLYLIRHDNSAVGAIAVAIQRADGNVGIGDSTPTEGKLVVNGTGYFNNTVTVGTPTGASHAATKSYVDSAVTGGTASSSVNTAACSADAVCEMNGANLQGGDITGVDKLTVTTIDPLYSIGGTKYSTYAPSIAGGVKEEYVGSAKLTRAGGAYSYTIDFDELKDGSALWVWRKTVDFSDDNVQVFVTPKKVPVPIAYEIEGNTITFRATAAVELSYRLVGNRFDWRSWPTLAKDQAERPSLIVK